MWSCHCCLIWAFDGWWVGSSGTRSWISLNMKGFLFFFSLQPYWLEWRWNEQSEEKKVTGARKKKREKEKENTHIWLRGEASEEFCSFYLNLLMFIWKVVGCCWEMLWIIQRIGQEGKTVWWDCNKPFVEFYLTGGRGTEALTDSGHSMSLCTCACVCFLLFVWWNRMW